MFRVTSSMLVAGLKTRASKAGVISPGPNWPSAPPLPAEEQELGCSWAALGRAGWAGLGLGWAGLGWAGLGWVALA